jgi:hypothetical protein
VQRHQIYLVTRIFILFVLGCDDFLRLHFEIFQPIIVVNEYFFSINIDVTGFFQLHNRCR